MSRAHAFNIFRQCRSSMSSQYVGRRSATRIINPARIGTRCYSDRKEVGETGEADSESQKGEEGLASSSEGAEGQESELLTKLKAKEQEVVDLTGRLRYLQADFLNLQRNTAREKEQTRDFAISRFAGDLLETVDVLSLALKSIPPSALVETPTIMMEGSETPSPSSAVEELETPSSSSTQLKSSKEYLQELHTGVDMTHRLLVQTLFKYGVKPYDPTGDKFDPNRHEALYQAPIPGKEPGTIIDCQKVGYHIKDRVLRAAQVGVVSESS